MNSIQPIKHEGPGLLKKNRFFTETNAETGEVLWFFNSREGVVGPYDSEESARLSLLLHIERNRQNARREPYGP